MKEVERRAEEGEYIKLIPCDSLYPFNRVGDILKVHQSFSKTVTVLPKDHPRFCIKHFALLEWPYCNDEYVVLEGYEPEEAAVVEPR